MLNRITITGRITADPELKKTQSDISVMSFSIACQRNFKNADNERETDFFDIVAWRSTAEFIERYFKKGSLITVDGRLQARRYTDSNDNKRVAVEIVAENVYFASAKSSPDDTALADNGEFVPDFESDDGDDLPF